MAYPQGASPVQPSLEAVQELKMETSVAPAEFSTAGNFQVITRSGTNDFHGGAFWGYNSSVLNARNFFSAKAPFRVYNDFGVFAGGPIKRNKLFFFADYEGSREGATISLIESVPLPPGKAATSAAALRSSLSIRRAGSRFRTMLFLFRESAKFRKPSRITRIPTPTMAVRERWRITGPRIIRGPPASPRFNHFDGRGDYNITDRDLLFARWSWRRMPLTVPGIYPLYRLQTRYAQSSVLAWNHTISPSAVNEFRFGTTYHRNFYTADVTGSALLQQFGITGVPTTGVKTGPYFNITGVTAFSPDAQSDNYQDNPETTFEWIDNLSWTRGRHFLKFGFDVCGIASTATTSIRWSTVNMISRASTPGSAMRISCWEFRKLRRSHCLVRTGICEGPS
jgi:hypothetical protein